MDDARPLTRVEPPRGWAPVRLGELVEYRELAAFLAWRDIKVRYKQTAIGVAWAVIQPVMTVALFSVVFGRMAGLPSEGVPYPLFALAALLPWQFFSTTLTGAANSVVGNAGLLTKVYFPRLVVPLASAVSTLVDLGISSGVLAALMAYYRIAPSPAIVALPAFLAVAAVAALGAGLWFAALNVRFRDVQYVLPFLMQLWLFASPVAYSASLVRSPLARAVYALNPMAGVVQGFRWALVGAPAPDFWMLAPGAIVACVLLASGLVFFKRMEDTFADVI